MRLGGYALGRVVRCTTQDRGTEGDVDADRLARPGQGRHGLRALRDLGAVEHGHAIAPGLLRRGDDGRRRENREHLGAEQLTGLVAKLTLPLVASKVGMPAFVTKLTHDVSSEVSSETSATIP